jgi:hypothetical protein
MFSIYTKFISVLESIISSILDFHFSTKTSSILLFSLRNFIFLGDEEDAIHILQAGTLETLFPGLASTLRYCKFSICFSSVCNAVSHSSNLGLK